MIRILVYIYIDDNYQTGSTVLVNTIAVSGLYGKPNELLYNYTLLHIGTPVNYYDRFLCFNKSFYLFTWLVVCVLVWELCVCIYFWAYRLQLFLLVKCLLKLVSTWIPPKMLHMALTLLFMQWHSKNLWVIIYFAESFITIEPNAVYLKCRH